MVNTRLMISMAALALAAGTGCGGSSDEPAGSFTLRITDAPVDSATAVVVEFTGVELQRAGGERENIDFDTAISIDLLQTQNGNAETLLANESIPASPWKTRGCGSCWRACLRRPVCGRIGSWISPDTCLRRT